MFIRLHDNISPKCCNIVSLWAASCRKTLLLEFWRTLKKSRCDIHPACCLIKLASYSTNVQDFKVGFVFIYCLGKFILNLLRIMHILSFFYESKYLVVIQLSEYEKFSIDISLGLVSIWYSILHILLPYVSCYLLRHIL